MIDHLVLDNSGYDSQGIFGQVGGSIDADECIIKNLIAGPNNSIKGKEWVGGLIGCADGSGTIKLINCGQEGYVEAANVNAAAMIGCMKSCALYLENCYNIGNIKGGSESAIISGWLAGHPYHNINGFWNVGKIAYGQDGDNSLYRNDSAPNNWARVYHLYNHQSATGTITTDDATSGKVAYLLNGSADAGTSWYQRIGVDSHPYPFAIAGGSVYGYKTLQCDGTANSVTGYTNTSIKTYQHDGHSVTDGVCSVCGTRFITTPAQLAAFATGVSSGIIDADVTAYIENNLNMKDVNFSGIGNDTYKYHGSLIGNGSTIISNLTINESSSTDVGLIRVATDGAQVKNITTDFTCSFKGNSQVGAIIGTLNGGGDVYVENCGNEAPVEAANYNAGGLVGKAFSSTIGHFTNCYNVGGVKSGVVANAAGLTFETEGAVFTNCYSFLDAADSEGLIDNCWFTHSESYTIDNCYDSNTSLKDGMKTFTTAEMADGTLKGKLGDAYINTIYGANAHPGFAQQVTMKLAENDDNTMPASDLAGQHVILNRTLVADNWNTICLPFDLGDLEVWFGAGTKAAEFSSELGGVLHFTLVTSLSANKPYLLYPKENKTSMTFSGITIQSGGAGSSSPAPGNYTFRGIYSPTNIDGKYFIAAGNKIKESNGGNLKGFRAYIEANGGSAREMSFVVDEANTTGIEDVKRETITNNRYYNLNGQRISMPVKGLYIVNGKKVNIK